MRIKTVFFGLVMALGLGVWGCSEDRKTEEGEEEQEEPKFKLVTIPPYCPATPFVFPVFIHDNYMTAGSKKIIPAHSPWRSSSSCDLLYIGRKADTLYTGKYDRGKHLFFYENLVDGRESYSLPNPLSISLKVDTSTIIPYESSRKDTLIKRYPVYIINTHFHTVNIGSESSIPIILEAQTPNQEWRPIQYRPYNICGNGASSTLLFPGEIAVTAVRVFRGPFKTKMRARFEFPFYTIVSNEFEGSIEVSQFSAPY